MTETTDGQKSSVYSFQSKYLFKTYIENGHIEDLDIGLFLRALNYITVF